MWSRSRPIRAFRPVRLPSLGRVPAPTSAPTTTAAATGRLVWVDVAKGAAILLVAVFHAGRVLHQADLVGEVWIQVNQVFSLVRMPVFFAASGLFLGSVLRRPWGRLWRTRLSPLVWAFAVWLLLRFAWFQLVPLPSRSSENDVDRLLAAAYAPANGLWFLHALVVFTVVAKLSARVPAGWQLAVSGAVSAALLGPLSLPSAYLERLGLFYVFFVGAGLLGPRIRATVATVTPAVTRGWVALLALLLASYVAVPSPWDTWLRLPIGVVAVVAAFLCADRVAGTRPGHLLARLGSLTLPVYVGHLIVIGAVTTALLALDVQPIGTPHEAWLLPVVALVSVAVSLVVHRALLRAGLGVLYTPPEWFRSGPRPVSRPVLSVASARPR